MFVQICLYENVTRQRYQLTTTTSTTAFTYISLGLRSPNITTIDHQHLRYMQQSHQLQPRGSKTPAITSASTSMPKTILDFTTIKHHCYDEIPELCNAPLRRNAIGNTVAGKYAATSNVKFKETCFVNLNLGKAWNGNQELHSSRILEEYLHSLRILEFYAAVATKNTRILGEWM
ncbi:hypothetical protein L2E82_51428 [Cichorium intybus]|nr:hypothetical protein L2E82_51428 [Cichorium intybus]